jgi:AcrR family transcriptional regulator
MPKITDAQRETRRQQILQAALRCFSRDGFHATTTADIVRESGVSQGTLYLYFATKDDIVVALADDRHQGEAFVNALAQSEQDALEGLFLLIELYGRGLTDPHRADARRVGIQGWAEALRNPRIRATAVEGLSLVREAIVQLIQKGQRSGQIRPDADAEAAARTLIATFQGLVLQVSWGEDVDLGACGRLMREMIRGALFTDAAKAADAKSRNDSHGHH